MIFSKKQANASGVILNRFKFYTRKLDEYSNLLSDSNYKIRKSNLKYHITDYENEYQRIDITLLGTEQNSTYKENLNIDQAIVTYIEQTMKIKSLCRDIMIDPLLSSNINNAENRRYFYFILTNSQHYIRIYYEKFLPHYLENMEEESENHLTVNILYV